MSEHLPPPPPPPSSEPLSESLPEPPSESLSEPLPPKSPLLSAPRSGSLPPKPPPFSAPRPSSKPPLLPSPSPSAYLSLPEPPPPPLSASPSSPSAPSELLQTQGRRSYGAVSDPHVDFYQMLHLEGRPSIAEVDQAIKQGIRWWNGQQANPKYRHLAPEAMARLHEARQTLLDPIRRLEYDRSLQAFRSSHRERRWEPIRDLADVLFAKSTVTWEQERLLKRYAAKRGFEEAEIERLVHEEFLRRNLERPAPPAPPVRSKARFTPGYRLASSFLFLSFGGIVAMSFSNQPRSAILLLVPFLNALRLLIRGLYTDQRPQEKTSAWDWLVGIAVLGGATLAALSDLRMSSWFPAGIGIAASLWGTWFYLSWLWKQTPLAPSPHDEMPL